MWLAARWLPAAWIWLADRGLPQWRAQQAGGSIMSRQLPDMSSLQAAFLWDMRHVRPRRKWIVEAPEAGCLCSMRTANGRPDLHVGLCIALCSCCNVALYVGPAGRWLSTSRVALPGCPSSCSAPGWAGWPKYSRPGGLWQDTAMLSSSACCMSCCESLF